MKSIKILILSDLHNCSDTNLADQNEYVYSNDLLNYFKEEGEKFNYIICAGDLSDMNQRKGYKATELLLNKLITQLTGKRSPKRIIFCPGNHDLTRNRLKELLKFCHTAFKSSIINDSDKTAEIIPKALLCYLEKKKSIKNLKNIHKHRFKEYNEFVKKFDNYQTKVGYTIEFEDIIFTSINAAWFCGFPDGRLDDMGHLIIGKQNYLNAMETKKKISNNNNTNFKPRICIMHHPPESFVWQEMHSPDSNKNSIEAISKEFNFIVTGHVHGISRIYYDHGNNCFLIRNGTAVNNNPETIMSFSILELELDNSDGSGKGNWKFYNVQKNGSKYEIKETNIEPNNETHKMKFQMKNDDLRLNSIGEK